MSNRLMADYLLFDWRERGGDRVALVKVAIRAEEEK